jgi:hypothetical protein
MNQDLYFLDLIKTDQKIISKQFLKEFSTFLIIIQISINTLINFKKVLNLY